MKPTIEVSFLTQTGNTIMEMHVVVIEFSIRIVPEFVISIYDGLVIMKGFHRIIKLRS